MNGHLHLIGSRYDSGLTYLRQQSFCAPLHLSKPHEDANALVVNIVNPTAGIFDGDHIEIRALVETGASMVLTTPSASRVYRSRHGATARVRQQFTVQPGGFLEFFPEPFIPHAGARYHQFTRLQVESGAGLLFFEWLTPGRVASGECFAYESLNWELDAFAEGQLVARERYRLSPSDDSLTALKKVSPEAHYVSAYVFGCPALPVEALEGLHGTQVYLGHGPLQNTGHVIKALCQDSLSARRTLKQLRQILYAAFERPMPTLGRY